MRRLAFPVVMGLAVAACGSRSSRAKAEHATLGGDTVARVGDLSIPASLVGSPVAKVFDDPRLVEDRAHPDPR